MRIEHLKQSITAMAPNTLHKLVHDIRTIRRTRPTKAIRAKKTVAKTKRNPKKRMATQDMFAYAQGLSAEAKLKLAAKLLGGK